MMMEPDELDRKVLKYQNCEGRPKAKLFLELIEQSGEHRSFSEKERRCYNNLRNCGTSYLRHFPDGFSKSYIRKCKEPLCHKCNDYERFALSEKVLIKTKKLFPYGEIDQKSVSSVTINLDKVPLGSDLSAITGQFKDTLTDLLKRTFPNVAMLGHFHVAAQRSICSGEQIAMPHYHAVFIHMENSLDEIKASLTKLFPKSNALKIEPLVDDLVPGDSIHILSAYAHNITFKYEGFDRETGSVLAKYLKSVESIRNGGRNGLRFESGYRRQLNKIQKIKQAVLSRLRARRAAKAVKDIDEQFPKDSCIQEELGSPNFKVLSEFLNYLQTLMKYVLNYIRLAADLNRSIFIVVGPKYHKRE